MTAQQLIWEAARRPVVRDPAGLPIAAEDLGRCAYCLAPAIHRVTDCLSSNFVVAKRLRLGASGLCAACAFCLRDLRLRCAPWIASAAGVVFCRERWGILDFLLSPPLPPFVAGVPWFGISKGGLGNLDYCRVWHPDRDRQRLSPAKRDDDGNVLRDAQVMPKLQSKHTAIFAQIATDCARYPLAIDDGSPVLVDVPLWRDLAHHIAVALRVIPVPCLEEWAPPMTTALQWREGVVRWRELTAPMERYRHAAWWRFLLAIVPRPERPNPKG